MSLYTLVRANWIDLLATVLMLKVTYNGSILGVGKQILPLLSLLFMLTISLHYYENFGMFIANATEMAQSVAKFIAFLIILMLLLLLNRAINRFIPIRRPEGLVRIERIAGIILGFFNALILTGLILIILLLTPIQGLEASLLDSVSGKFIVKQCLNLYVGTVNFINNNKDLDRLTTSVMFSQIRAEKDYKMKLFDFELKKKSRYYRESEILK